MNILTEEECKSIPKKCTCYIGETESLGNPILRRCPLHRNATQLLETVETLYKHTHTLTNALHAAEHLYKRNEELTNALQFYANIVSASEARRLFVMDAGKRARAVLDKKD